MIKQDMLAGHDLRQSSASAAVIVSKALNNAQQRPDMLTRPFLSVKDVADLLQVGEAAVRHWIKASRLRAINLGREWRIAPSDLEAFLQTQANRLPDDAARSP